MDATNRRRPSSSHPVRDVDESLASEIADLGLDPAAGAKPRRFDARIARLKQREEDLQRLLASVSPSAAELQHSVGENHGVVTAGETEHHGKGRSLHRHTHSHLSAFSSRDARFVYGSDHRHDYSNHGESAQYGYPRDLYHTSDPTYDHRPGSQAALRQAPPTLYSQHSMPGGHQYAHAPPHPMHPYAPHRQFDYGYNMPNAPTELTAWPRRNSNPMNHRLPSPTSTSSAASSAFTIDSLLRNSPPTNPSGATTPSEGGLEPIWRDRGGSVRIPRYNHAAAEDGPFANRRAKSMKSKTRPRLKGIADNINSPYLRSPVLASPAPGLRRPSTDLDEGDPYHHMQ